MFCFFTELIFSRKSYLLDINKLKCQRKRLWSQRDEFLCIKDLFSTLKELQ